MIFAKGKRGLIYKEKINGKDVIIKVPHPDSQAKEAVNNEIRFLKLLNKKGIGPKFIKSCNNKLWMEYIEGETIVDFISHSSKKEVIAVLKKVFEQMFILDKMQINKLEMTHPHKHIIVRENKPILIDFERCKYTLKPKNVTQFCQFITSTNMKELLDKKGIFIDKEKMMRTAGEYKKDYSKKAFNGLLANFATFK